MSNSLTISGVRQVADHLKDSIIRTPTVPYTGPLTESLAGTQIFFKLEYLQYGGSFKARGALNSIYNLKDKSAGVTAFSAGNHAIAVAYAAKKAGVSARVVMPKTANPFRVERCRYWDAEIVFGDNIADVMSIADALVHDEGRTLIHPFEGVHTVEGTATVGLEICDDVTALDAVIVPVGGGGLISGIASMVKQLQPGCSVYGVEPAGSCGMAQSIDAGSALPSVATSSIADSLSAPMHLPMTYALVQQNVDQLVQVSDDELRNAMRYLFNEMKIAVEPACAAAIAALHGPLRDTLRGKRVALIACGSNIDMDTYLQLLNG